MTNILLIFGGFITIVTFIGMCFVYLRGSADKGTMASQAGLIESRGNEIADLGRRVTRVEAENATLRAENKTLRTAVSHVEEIVQMQETLDRNHSEQVAVLGRILVALEAIAA